MPQIFKIGSYWVFFWSNESDPLESVHVHVSSHTLHNIMRIIEARSGEIIRKWTDYFGKAEYFC